MKGLHAYILAADPTWIEVSVKAYYGSVEKIVVSYDQSGRGWTGARIPVDECLERLKRIDADKKMQFVPGHFSEGVRDPMENDTLQRNTALELASDGARWVLQLDTDEWLPNVARFIDAIHRADALGVPSIEWPMRVLFRRLGEDRVLEVCGADGNDHFEYIAPVAIRSGLKLSHSRRTDAPFLRATVRGDNNSMQLKRFPQPGEVREDLLLAGEAIVHNSWARTPAEMRRKLASWSHSSLQAWMYYFARWWPSIWFWQWMKDIHPFFGGVWPALRLCGVDLPVQGPWSHEVHRSSGKHRSSHPEHRDERLA